MFRNLYSNVRSRNLQFYLNLRCAGTASPATASTAHEEIPQYSKAELERVLAAINMISTTEELLKFDISKIRAHRIRMRLSKNGPFSALDQMLELDGFGIKVIKKFVASILDEAKPSGKQRASRGGKYTTPEYSETNIKTCTAIHVGVTSLAWAQLSLRTGQSTVLTEWTYHHLSDEKMHLVELVSAVLAILKDIPESDIYVFESQQIAQAPGQQGTPAQFNINVQLSQIIAMVSMAMALRCRAPVPEETVRQVLFLREFLSSRLFNTIVGTERVSTESIISELMNSKFANTLKKGGIIEGELSVGENFKSIYTEALGYQKEFMGRSLLLALTFLRLCVLQCPRSMASVGRRGNR